jgi:DNA end-binding protein Ku
VRSQDEIEEAVSGTEVKDAEMDLARQVIDSLTDDFEAEELVSEYRQDLRSMLEAKLEGQEIKRPEPEPEEAPVIDLMEALRQSVSEAQKDKPPAKAKAKASRSTGTRKRAAAGKK